MKNNELFLLLNKEEVQEINGGNVPASYYMDSDTMKQNWDNVCSAAGVVCGFFAGLVGL